MTMEALGRDEQRNELSQKADSVTWWLPQVEKLSSGATGLQPDSAFLRSLP